LQTELSVKLPYALGLEPLADRVYQGYLPHDRQRVKKGVVEERLLSCYWGGSWKVRDRIEQGLAGDSLRVKRRLKEIMESYVLV
jgi:hypothetical protein